MRNLFRLYGKVKLWPVTIVFALVLLCSCSAPRVSAESEPPVHEASSAVQSDNEVHDSRTDVESGDEDDGESYVAGLAAGLASELGLERADGERAVRRAYRYMIENIYFTQPVGLDIWRYLSDDNAAIPYIENRSISPFLFQLGSCEDFAAAMTMLLEAAGFEAVYVAGYTLSVDMVYIDHAWTLVRLDGGWYHLDPQLEQNVMKGNLLTYRYYLRSDSEMQLDHKWGENLIAYWSDMPEAEKVSIRKNYLVPECAESFARPEAENAGRPAKPDMADIEHQINQIRKRSGKEALPPLALNVEPPVLVKEHHITPPLTGGQTELYEAADSILAGISEGSGEFERALFIHDYLAGNVEYDKAATGIHSGEAYGAIVERLANCDGYALAFELLCERAGLESIYITGKSPRGVKHAWNAVMIDGLWYYVDVTWDRPRRSGDGVYHDYFLIDLEEISADHIPDEGQSLAPVQNEPGMGYYERKGYFVKDSVDRTKALTEAFFAQLESIEADVFSGAPEPVFLEVKVLGGKQNYLEYKEHYIKNAFNILKEMRRLASERASPFDIIANASVKCDFNDVTQVFTFYPSIQRLDNSD